ncbi:hypothetical protein B0T14DRAFT_525852 [Immersiella caudata]|uniref:Uncharacterized protein n=1 Tax=Immersiella caudata TaxID=314043 RepID=A0AA39WD62_9PEZI|nr:hypothetical protein B0T14DRAFT_525852 [Immersiella caudata]
MHNTSCRQRQLRAALACASSVGLKPWARWAHMASRHLAGLQTESPAPAGIFPCSGEDGQSISSHVTLGIAPHFVSSEKSDAKLQTDRNSFSSKAFVFFIFLFGCLPLINHDCMTSPESSSASSIQAVPKQHANTMRSLLTLEIRVFKPETRVYRNQASSDTFGFDIRTKTLILVPVSLKLNSGSRRIWPNATGQFSSRIPLPQRQVHSKSASQQLANHCPVTIMAPTLTSILTGTMTSTLTSAPAAVTTFTPSPWCFNEFVWTYGRAGAEWGRRTALTPPGQGFVAFNQRDPCYPPGYLSPLDGSTAACPSGWDYKMTTGLTWACCPSSYTYKQPTAGVDSSPSPPLCTSAVQPGLYTIATRDDLTTHTHPLFAQATPVQIVQHLATHPQITKAALGSTGGFLYAQGPYILGILSLTLWSISLMIWTALLIDTVLKRRRLKRESRSAGGDGRGGNEEAARQPTALNGAVAGPPAPPPAYSSHARGDLVGPEGSRPVSQRPPRYPLMSRRVLRAMYS